MQAGFRKKHETIQQLQNVLMTLEDAKLYKQDVYALIVDFTLAYNTDIIPQTMTSCSLLCLIWDFQQKP